MNDDYHMMLSRKKNVRALASMKKTDNTHRPKNYLRIYVVGSSGALPSEKSTLS